MTPEDVGPGLYVGRVFHVSLRNANVRAKSVKGGWKYELVAEMTAEDFEMFNGHDLTGSCFEAQVECTEVAQTPGPEKPKGGPLSIEAAKKCGEPLFIEYVSSFMDAGDPIDGDTWPDRAKNFICQYCGVLSRAELDHQPTAAKRFQQLMQEFEEWTLEG